MITLPAKNSPAILKRCDLLTAAASRLPDDWGANPSHDAFDVAYLAEHGRDLLIQMIAEPVGASTGVISDFALALHLCTSTVWPCDCPMGASYFFDKALSWSAFDKNPAMQRALALFVFSWNEARRDHVARCGKAVALTR